MTEALAKLVGNFLYRDLTYIVGGGAVVLLTLRLLRLPWPKEAPVAIWVIYAGFAYGLGWATMDLMSLTPLARTTMIPSPGRYLQCVMARLEHKEWKPLNVERETAEKNSDWVLSNGPDEFRETLRRLRELMVVGAGLGSSALVCSALLALIGLREWCKPLAYQSPRLVPLPPSTSLVLAVAAFLLAWALLTLGQIKAVQLATYSVRFYSEANNTPP
jgi:hypothetical protein